MADEIAILIGSRLRERREYLERTQEEVARKIDRGRSNLAQIEAGTVKVSAVDLARLADVLRVPVAYFFGDIPPNAMDEEEIVALYRGMPEATKPVALAVLRAMLASSDKSG